MQAAKSTYVSTGTLSFHLTDYLYVYTGVVKMVIESNSAASFINLTVQGKPRKTVFSTVQKLGMTALFDSNLFAQPFFLDID